MSTTPGNGVDYVRINAIGAVVISFITLGCGAYLLFSLIRQGRGKLRVRFLTGMVFSDIFIGFLVLPPELRYVTGRSLIEGTPGCDAVGFLLTTVLFTQHMWALIMAIATYLLLKHPLSKATMYMERYSWSVLPGIWAISVLHSGLWYKYYGFSSTGGNLCYYGGDPDGVTPDARDLIQFIPRAIVFLTIFGLYSKLYTFLRRPDTIQISSNFGGESVITADGRSRRPSVMQKMTKLAFGGAGKGQTESTGFVGQGTVDNRPPWEKLEFVQVGNRRLEDDDQTPRNRSAVDFQPTVPSGIILANPIETLQEASEKNQGGLYFGSSFGPSPSEPELSGRGSSSSSGGEDGSWTRARGSDAETLVTPTSRDNVKADSKSRLPVSTSRQTLSPVLSLGKEEFDTPLTVSGLSYEEGESTEKLEDTEGNDQSMADFFKEYQVTTEMGAAERGAGTSSSGTPQLSATAYFNRQASLLMLYFPLAYLVVFSVSLIRLIYDLISIGPPNPILSIVSAWMVISVGFIDGLVYGLAEYMVKRRVRRKMPDRL